MNHFEEENEIDKGLKSMENKFRISEKEEKYILNEINLTIDKNGPTKIQKSPQRNYYIASIASVFLLIILAIPLLSNVYETGSNEFSKKTFNIAYTPVIQNEIDNPNKYHSLMTVEFLDEKVFTNTIYGEGTYKVNDDVLVLHFENEAENLIIEFKLKESDKAFSKYSAVISDVDFEITDNNKISHLKGLFVKLDKQMSIEFIKK
ncbi:hypothetical protein [Bacillus suaedae]|uniref:Uncharacterized protein n=1 Tax=Halalkalibacter suaedae TaxID=2822140 RepID=A0A940WZM3_9BACI|nr:hypothetical protein [Bacillus suaedae]MBP3951810.1 hypothetical protein [Bacillus suaedae]